MEKPPKPVTKIVAVRLLEPVHDALMKTILQNETKSSLLRRVVDSFLKRK